MTRSNWAKLAATTALAAALTSPAFAEAPAPGASRSVEEVIVTAEHRAANVQTTPISLTAITATTIADSGIKRVEDFANLLPNVYIDDRNLRGQNIAIRGISADLNNPGLDQGVGVFIDGVYLGRATGANTNLFNLERVEVLRGPQGTLYGKNAIAGAINYITRKPTDDAGAEADVSYGNHQAFTGSAMVSGPLVAGKLFASLGASVDTREGLIRNLTTGRRDDNRNGRGARAVIVALPADNVEVVLRGDLSRDRTRSGSFEVVDNGQFTGSPFAQPAPSTRTVAQNRDPRGDRDTGGVSGEINWKVGGGTLTSLTAYRYSNWYNLADNDYTALDLLASGITEDQTQFSQEVRFASAGDRPFTYVVGAYYFRQDLDTDSAAIVGPDLGVYPSVVTGHILADLTTDSYAAFANGAWHFNDKLSLTGGIRFTREEKSVTQSQIGDPFQLLLATTAPRSISRSENNVSPTIGLNYEPSDDLFVYAKVSRGYKSGGFNVFSITPTDNAEYAPEHVTNYEGGFKSEFLDRRLQLNVSAYLLDYRNLQASQLLLINGLSVFQTSNAARARSIGAEVTVAARPTPDLTLSATYGYNDATFRSYRNATSTGEDYTGNRLPRAPRSNASLAAQYEHPLTSDLALFARGEASYRSKIYFAPNNVFTQGDVTLVNARVGLQSRSRGWGAYLWVRNLGNKDYAIDKQAGAIVQGQGIEAIAAPRTFGVELRARY
jgi:iron complex outermembrane receptor protein